MIGRVYKIVSKDKTYIGSTVETLEERLRVHHNHYKFYLDGKYNYVTSYEVIKDEHEIQLLYEGEFETREDLHRMEGEYQRKIECVNRCIAGRTDAEYYQANKDDIDKKSREYYQEHKPHLLEIMKEYRTKYKKEISKKKKRKIYLYLWVSS
jgi:hypothetical protein